MKKIIFAKKNAMRILSVKQFSSRLKVTIQSSGRLNFTDDTAKILGLFEDSPIKFAIDDDNDNSLYLVIAADMNDEDAFKVRKSGTYHYVPTKTLFDALGIDYVGKSLSYDLIRNQSKDEELGGMAFKMSLKVKNNGAVEDEASD